MFQNKIKVESYDKLNQRPVLKCSICNGERVAGFKDIHTGKFEEVMLIRNDRDLDWFMEKYDMAAITKEYETCKYPPASKKDCTFLQYTTTPGYGKI